MFSSIVQYLCVFPCYTNVVNVYAFCNLHEAIRPGLPDKSLDDLPSVLSFKTDGGELVEQREKLHEDVDASYKNVVTRAITKNVCKKVPAKPTLDDQNRTFRTRLVTLWVLSNAGLALTVGHINGLGKGDRKSVV